MSKRKDIAFRSSLCHQVGYDQINQRKIYQKQEQDTKQQFPAHCSFSSLASPANTAPTDMNIRKTVTLAPLEGSSKALNGAGFKAHKTNLVNTTNRMSWLYHQLKPKPWTFSFPQQMQAKGNVLQNLIISLQIYKDLTSSFVKVHCSLLY